MTRSATSDDAVEHSGSVGHRSRFSWQAIVAVALTMLALSPFIAVVATRTGDEHVPIYDEAVVDLRTRDVFSEDPPLIGPFSRYRWSHPGPLMFVVPALTGLPFGHPAWATLVGGAILQGLAVALVAVLAWRRGGLVLLVVALGGLGMAYSAMGDWIVLIPLNVAIAYPYLVLLALLTWSLAEGSRWSWVGIAVVATLLVQSHLGYAILALACILLAAGLTATRARLTGGEVVVPILVALGSALVLWLPPLVQQLTSELGNLGFIVDHFTGDAPYDPLGWRAGAEVMAAEFRPPLPWFGGSDPVIGSTPLAAGASIGWLAGPAMLLGAAALAARRRRSARAGALVVLGAVLGTAALVSATRVTDEVAIRFSVLWRTPVAVIVVLAGVGALVVVSLEPWRSRARIAAVSISGCGMLLGFGGLTLEVLDGREVSSDSARIMVEGLDRPPGDVLVRGYSALGPEGLHAVVVNELDRRGAGVYVPESAALKFGEHRTAGTAEVDAIWYVVENGNLATYLAAQPGARTLVRTTSLTPAEEDELRSLESEVIAALVATRRTELIRRMDGDDALAALRDVAGVDRDDLERMIELGRLADGKDPCRCAVIAFPPGAEPPDVF